MGICIQNLGAIRFELNDFNIAYVRFSTSVKYLETELKTNLRQREKVLSLFHDEEPLLTDIDSDEKKDDVLRLAFRLFQKCLTGFLLLLQYNPGLLLDIEYY